MRQAILLMLVVGVAGCQNGGMMMHGGGHGEGWHKLITPDQIKWEPGPPSLPPGTKIAALEGDPAKPGFFTFRAWVPDGYKIGPHTHPNPERVTVISGTMMLGEGEVWDDSKLVPMPPGTYSTMSAGMKHFAAFKGDTVIQVSSQGPWGITYVNPADDPRNKGK